MASATASIESNDSQADGVGLFIWPTYLAASGQARPVAMAVYAGLRLQRTSEPNFRIAPLVDLSQCGKNVGDL